MRLATADSSTFPIDAGSVDLLFIDGDHSYEGASRDVSHWLPSLRPGGILVLHDATRAEPSRPWNRPPDSETLGVRQLAGELRSRTDFDEMTAPGTLAQFRYAGSGESVAG